MNKELQSRVEDFDDAAAALVNCIADLFPLGRRCAIIRTRKGVGYRIYGIIYGHPKVWMDQHRLSIKTDSRGTVMGADFEDVELL